MVPIGVPVDGLVISTRTNGKGSPDSLSVILPFNIPVGVGISIVLLVDASNPMAINATSARQNMVVFLSVFMLFLFVFWS